MKLNIKQIAKKAGVSVATISRAINPDTRKKIAPATLEKIDRLVRQYGYTPSLAAKNLRMSSTKTIGIIFPYVHNLFYSSYYTHLLAGLANFLLDTDYRFKILLLRGDKKTWDGYDFKKGEGVDGMIITHWFKFFSKEFMSKGLNIPFVIINDFDEDLRASFVCGDHFAGGKAVGEYLFSLGHRQLAVITGPPASMDSNERLRGLQSYLKELNISLRPDCVLRGDYDDDKKVRNAVDEIVKKQPRITAIFCCNDHMAFVAIDRLRELGVSCPEEVSVVGYDDDFRAASFNPPLTTIHVPLYDLAEKAARSLLDYLKETQSDTRKPFTGKTLLPVYLVERKTAQKIEA